jgi:hypothetical protein
MSWVPGRLGSGYFKFPLVSASLFGFGFDSFILKMPTGSVIERHTDPAIFGKRHFRTNFIFRRAEDGGRFILVDGYAGHGRFHIFRPDIEEHCVSRVNKGTRYALSVGFSV